MKLQDFTYELPEELIAQEPLKVRDQARLMVIERKTGTISHDTFSNIGKYLPPKAALVVNDSKVIPARLLGHRATGGKVEIFLLKQLSDGYSFEALIRPLKRLRVDERINFNGGKVYAELKDPLKKIVRFNKKNIIRELNRIGHIPLPPYIKRADVPSDRTYYQTVYAKNAGSVASPTAGLHFTNPLLARIKKAGHKVHKVTLHINYATFKMVEEEDITRHKMHEEEYSISQSSMKALQNGRQAGCPVVCVGTTSCRVLESAARTGELKGVTAIFLYPGAEFKMVDALITNFHLPQSTLLMLVYACGGVELMRRAYKEAIARKYRFYSYGDGMVIL